MTAYKVVVDGSNVATEGRSLPSLGQLDEAVRAFIEEHPGADVLVIVDSSFPNRIDPKEVATFESAYNAGEIITPPAGTIGRGDSFILKVADKLGATIFSNDSFQEFHGTYDWLFEKGRLVGGKPIPGLGWVFMPRTPVRGPKSREAVRESKRSQVRIGSAEAMKPMPVPKAPPPFTQKKNDEPRRSTESRARDPRNDDQRQSLPTQPSESRGKKRRRRRGGAAESGSRVEAVVGDAINDPMTFLTFLGGNLVGSSVEGIVETYSSHGFYVTAAAARCYVQLSGVSVPAPRSAKEVVRRGETRTFIVVGFDTERRGIELALQGTLAASSATGQTGEPSSIDVVSFDSEIIDESVRGKPGRGTRGGRKETGAETNSKRLSKKGGAVEAPQGEGDSAVFETASPASEVAPPVGARPSKSRRPDRSKATAMPHASRAEVSADAPATSETRPTKPTKIAKAASAKPVPSPSAPAAPAPSGKSSLAKKASAVTSVAKKSAKRSDAKPAKSAAKKSVAKKSVAKKSVAKKSPAEKASPPATAPSKSTASTAKRTPVKVIAAKAVPKVSPTKATSTKAVPKVSPTKATSTKAGTKASLAKATSTKALPKALSKAAAKTTRAAKK